MNFNTWIARNDHSITVGGKKMTQIKGVIKKGMKADLLLLEADPLKDIGNTRKINAVFRKGVYYSRESLDNLLKEALVLGN